MTVATHDTDVMLLCDGVTTIFPLSGLVYLAKSDLVVALVDEDNNATPWTLGADYDLSGDGSEGAGVLTTLAGDPLAGDLRIFARRETDDIQNQQFVEGAGFPAQNVERGFDRAAMRSQETKARLSRAVRLADHMPAQDALTGNIFGNILEIDEDGQIVATRGFDEIVEAALAALSETQALLEAAAAALASARDEAIADVEAAGEAQTANLALLTSISPPFDDTTAGLAATAVTTNKFFTVKGNGAEIFAKLYKNTAGVAVHIGDFPSVEALNDALEALATAEGRIDAIDLRPFFLSSVVDETFNRVVHLNITGVTDRSKPLAVEFLFNDDSHPDRDDVFAMIVSRANDLTGAGHTQVAQVPQVVGPFTGKVTFELQEMNGSGLGGTITHDFGPSGSSTHWYGSSGGVPIADLYTLAGIRQTALTDAGAGELPVGAAKPFKDGIGGPYKNILRKLMRGAALEGFLPGMQPYISQLILREADAPTTDLWAIIVNDYTTGLKLAQYTKTGDTDLDLADFPEHAQALEAIAGVESAVSVKFALDVAGYVPGTYNFDGPWQSGLHRDVCKTAGEITFSDDDVWHERLQVDFNNTALVGADEYDTLADLRADLDPDHGTIAYVTDDGGNTGSYIKEGDGPNSYWKRHTLFRELDEARASLVDPDASGVNECARAHDGHRILIELVSSGESPVTYMTPWGPRAWRDVFPTTGSPIPPRYVGIKGRGRFRSVIVQTEGDAAHDATIQASDMNALYDVALYHNGTNYCLHDDVGGAGILPSANRVNATKFKRLCLIRGPDATSPALGGGIGQNKRVDLEDILSWSLNPAIGTSAIAYHNTGQSGVAGYRPSQINATRCFTFDPVAGFRIISLGGQNEIAVNSTDCGFEAVVHQVTQGVTGIARERLEAELTGEFGGPVLNSDTGMKVLRVGPDKATALGGTAKALLFGDTIDSLGTGNRLCADTIEHTFTVTPGDNHDAAHYAFINWAGYPRMMNLPVWERTTGALPGGLAAKTIGYLKPYTGSETQICAEPDGDPLAITSMGTGVHTIRVALDLSAALGDCSGVNKTLTDGSGHTCTFTADYFTNPQSNADIIAFINGTSGWAAPISILDISQEFYGRAGGIKLLLNGTGDTLGDPMLTGPARGVFVMGESNDPFVNPLQLANGAVKVNFLPRAVLDGEQGAVITDRVLPAALVPGATSQGSFGVEDGAIVYGHPFPVGEVMGDKVVLKDSAPPVGPFAQTALYGANMNTTAGQRIPVYLPASGWKWIPDLVYARNASANLTTAAGGINTQSDGSGDDLVADAQLYTALTDATKGLRLTLAAGMDAKPRSEDEVFLKLTTPQGHADTADFHFTYRLIPPAP